VVLIVTVGICGMVAATSAQDLNDQKFQIGFRGGTFLADGEPANDLPMFGIYGRYNWSEKWHFGLSLDYLSGDFERPYKLLGITSTDELDADMTNIIITLWGEREFIPDGKKLQKLRPFIAGGLGIGLVDADDVSGTVAGGGQFNIETDAGTEFIPALAVGLRYLFGERWEAEIAGRYSYHIADWDVEDRISGKSDSVDNYSTYGFYLGLGFRF
ncbi:MAG: outer membrane beta-barrel protein, partial [Planctomycetota bacterium]